MASWIVHLRIADNLMKLIGGLDAEQFGIGNIAPDAGIPDEKWQNFKPSPQITHFQASQEAAFPSQDLVFYRQYLAPTEWDKDPERFSFLLGYFFHLITDNLWSVKIHQPTRVRYAYEFERHPGFIGEVKRDWYGLDFIYVDTHPEAFFWRIFLESQYRRDYLDILPIEAVQERVRYIKDFYQRRDEKIEQLTRRPFMYLNQENMDTFVEKTTERLFQIYELIWQGDPQITADHTSSLELPV
jgi:hypothetical protein